MQRYSDARAGSWLLVALLVVAFAAFGLTRVLRATDDIVNTVELTRHLEPGGEAEVRFTTTIADRDASVFIIDSEQRPVRALLENAELAAGPHRLSWDGSSDAGVPVPAGEYGLRVVLGAEGRDIVPPGSIAVAGDDEESPDPDPGGAASGKSG